MTVVSATDAWAVGLAGLIEHWNGTRWKVSQAGTGQLTGVSATARTDVWVVGAHAQAGTAVAEHFDGARWTVVALPQPAGTNVDVFPADVVAISRADAWWVGWFVSNAGGGVIAQHWGGIGAGWTIDSPPSGGFLNGVSSIPGGTDVWTVGNRGIPGTLRHLTVIEQHC